MTSSSEADLGEKIKRPMNAFILWSRERRRELANEDPNMHNFEISKRLGIEWNRLDVDEKKHFYDQAEKLKEEHRKNYPDYKYHPRRKPRRRFTPINPVPHYRMAYYFPSQYVAKTHAYQPGYATHPGQPMLSNTVVSSLSAGKTPFLHDVRYYPQSHPFMNTDVPISYCAGMNHISSSVVHRKELTNKSKEFPMDVSPRFEPGGLIKREELLRRAEKSSLKLRDDDHDDITKPSVYDRHIPSTYMCAGCQAALHTM